VFVWPLFLPLRWHSRQKRVGLILYGVGLVIRHYRH